MPRLAHSNVTKGNAAFAAVAAFFVWVSVEAVALLASCLFLERIIEFLSPFHLYNVYMPQRCGQARPSVR